MTGKYVIQFGLAIMFLLFSTAVTWYEGSTILDRSFEWKHSAIFSQWLNGEVKQPSDISQLDFFIYAAKFNPTFPVLMMASFLYLLILSGYLFLKRNHKKFAFFLSGTGILLLLISSFISNSPTVGGNLFTTIFLISGIGCVIGAFLFYLPFRKKEVIY